MRSALILLPQEGFDPTEVAVPWRAWTGAGIDVRFATQAGTVATCDQITLTGQGLPLVARSLRARSENVALYQEMTLAAAFNAPLAWENVRLPDYQIVHFPGGHAAGMRPYLESGLVQQIARDAFAADLMVTAICHGVVPLARAGVLAGRKTTALTAMMEGISVALTSHRLGDHYRTYPQSVEAEVISALSAPGDFERGPLLPRFATEARPELGFVVRDGNYLSARWPGDAWTLAQAACASALSI